MHRFYIQTIKVEGKNKTEETEVIEALSYDVDANNNLSFFDEHGAFIMMIHAYNWTRVTRVSED